MRTASSIVNGIFKATLTEQFNTNTDSTFEARHEMMDKIFIVKEEGKDIFNHQNNDLGKGTSRNGSGCIEVQQQLLRLPFSARTESSSNRLLPVVAGQAVGCDVDKPCAKGGCHQRM